MPGKEGGLSDLHRRLQLLEDERAILATLYRYAHCIDYGLNAEWVDLFTGRALTTDAAGEDQKRVAIKVIDDRGNELMVVKRLIEAKPVKQAS